jgi:hypothetical protein
MSEISRSHGGKDEDDNILDITQCNPYKLTDVSEEFTASFIRAMMEAIRSSETSVSIYQTALCNVLEDSYLHVYLKFI